MSNQNWWASKLTGQPSSPTYVPPQQPNLITTGQTSTPPVQQQVPMGELCPDCRSANYGGATPEARKRCYDCGYPIKQSASGLGKGIVGNGGSPTGSPVPTVQLSTANNFNPQTFIGKIE